MMPVAALRLRTPETDIRAIFGAGAAGLWYDYMDPATLYQDAARTSPILIVTNPIGSASDVSGHGQHMFKATATARPTWGPGAYFDGADDELATVDFPAGTLTNNMDCFMAIRRQRLDGTAFLAYMTSTQTRFFGTHAAGSTNPVTALGCGALVTYAVNGIEVPGGTSTTRGQLSDALVVGQTVVVETRNLDLSAWTRFSIGFGGGLPLKASFAGIVLCPAQTADGRARIRQYLAAKAGGMP